MHTIFRREIKKNREKIDENSRKIDENRKMIDGNSKNIISLQERMASMEKRMEKHEQESRKDRKAILDILHSYEQVTDKQYKENKVRIDKLEKRLQLANV